MSYIQYMKPGSKFWQNFGDAIQYSRATSTPDGGGAYYITSQAKEDLREQGKEDEAKQIEKAEAVGTVGGAIAGLTITNLPTFIQTMKWLGTPSGKTLLSNIGKDMLVGTTGYLATDEASKAMTGKTVGQQVADGLGKVGLEKVPYSIREGIGNFVNPGGWLTWGGGSNIANQLYMQGKNLIGKGIQHVTPYVKSAIITNKLNKQIKNTKLTKPLAKLNLQDGHLFHNGHVEVSPAGYNGKKYTYIHREAKPGALKIEEGKYKSVRQPYGDNPDLIWWDAKGHNYGKKVYVTKQGNDAIHVMSNMEDLPISQVIERYEPSYYVTKQKPVNSVIEYTFDPISGAPIPHMPGKVLNNKMSYEEILTHPVQLQTKATPPKTSLAFFERQPAKISEAERLGISKGDRGNLSRFQKEALEDLTTYRNKWIRQKYPQLDSNGNIIWSNGTNKSFLDTYVAPLRGDQYKGVQLYPHIKDDGSYLMRMSMGSDDLNGGFAGYDGISTITLTSPKMNAINQEIPIPIEQASPTLPKEGVKTFWVALQDVAQPGSYISGDFGGRPLGYNLIRQYNKIGTPIVSTTNTGVRAIIGRNGYQNVINELFRKIPWKSHYDGLSTDSYMALLKQGNRPGYKLRFSKDGFTNWNHQSFENKYIQDLYEQALIDPTKQQEFLKVFHDWIAPYGGHDAVIKNGKIIIPQPFIVRQKSGGSIKSKKENKGKFAKVRDYVDYKNNK